ncbi:hypothetical protein R5R35_004917 [Gryllus longicercus]|uniref:Secreted protein n=1 Tax=Gryllus longicercus TaxID=2509291 RepID=A0AAN9VDT8_9ORTH
MALTFLRLCHFTLQWCRSALRHGDRENEPQQLSELGMTCDRRSKRTQRSGNRQHAEGLIAETSITTSDIVFSTCR